MIEIMFALAACIIGGWAFRAAAVEFKKNLRLYRHSRGTPKKILFNEEAASKAGYLFSVVLDVAMMFLVLTSTALILSNLVMTVDFVWENR